MKRVTLADIARKAGVGVATVDRVLNARAPVRRATAEKVLVAAEDLGYHARGLLRQRLDAAMPVKRLGFILQKRRKWFYQRFAKELYRLAEEPNPVRARLDIRYVGSLSPGDIAAAVRDLSQTVDAIGLVSIDHPEIDQAIADCGAAGTPVVAMLSPLSTSGLAGFVGVDGLKAGRTAGWLMSRCVSAPGAVGQLVGSRRYLGHENREMGFQSYMRDAAPDLTLVEPRVFLDDPDIAEDATRDLIECTPDIVAIHHVGGGASGVIEAVRRSDRELFFISHERSASAEEATREGVIDVLIAAPVTRLAEASFSAVARAATGARREHYGDPIPFEVLTCENI